MKRICGTSARIATACLAAALLMPASLPEYAVRWVKYRGNVPQRPPPEHDRDFMAMCAWVRSNTNIADVFIVPPAWNHFALFAQRSMVASAKELWFIIYEPDVGVMIYERVRTVQAAYENPSPAALPEAARRYGARFVVTREKELKSQPVFQSEGYRVYEVRW